MENLEAQPATIESGLRLCPSGLFLSPITLRPRFNPNATVEIKEPKGELPSTVDPRQRTLVGACWTAGSLAAVLRCKGIVGLTYFETTGWRGVMETSHGSLLPDRFESVPNEIFPVYYVFESLAEAHSVLALRPAPDGLAVLGLSDENGIPRYLVVNLEVTPKRVRCRSAREAFELRGLNSSTLEDARNGIAPKPEVLRMANGSGEFDLPGISITFIRARS